MTNIKRITINNQSVTEKMKTIVLVGAGCSKGLANLPIDNEFLRKLENEICQHYFLKEALDCLYESIFKGSIKAKKNLWTKERLEVCWNEIDENYNRTKIISPSNKIDNWSDKFYYLAQGEKSRFKYYSAFLYYSHKAYTPYQYLFMFAGWELRKLTAKTYSKLLNEEEKELYHKLRDKIIALSNQSVPSYISFNYDTLLEQALGNYYYLALDDKIEGNYPILKPHGSVNWLHTAYESITSEKEPIPIDRIGFDNGILYQHSIVGLVANKIEFDSQKQFKLHSGEVANLYADRIISEFKLLLREAEQLIIIGYSFPFTDTHVRNIFIESHPTNLKKIILVDKLAKNNIEKSISAIIGLLKISSDKIAVYDNGVENWINT
jgi:hypothetical protein